MAEKTKMLVYSQQDMQLVLNFIDSLQYTGVITARKVSSIATVLEAGKPLEDYVKGGEDDGLHKKLHPNHLEG